MTYVFLGGAILAEVAATLSLRASDGFSKLGFTALVAIGYITAFALLAQALERGLALGVAYGIWAAAGISLVAILSIPFFGESLSTVQIAGLALVISGVLALELGAAH